MPCTLPPLQPGMSQWGTRAARGGVHPLATGRLWAASGAARASPPVRAHSVALPPRHPWPRVPWYWACVGQPGGGVGCHPLLGARFALAPRAVGLWGCCSGERSAVPAKPSQKKPAFSVAGPLAGLRGISLFRKPVCVDKQDFRAESACVRKTVMLVRPVEDLPRHDGSMTVRVYPISGRDGTGVQSLRRSWLHLHQRQLLALPLRQQRLVYLRQRRSGAAHLKAEYHHHHTAGRQRFDIYPSVDAVSMAIPFRRQRRGSGRAEGRRRRERKLPSAGVKLTAGAIPVPRHRFQSQ